MLGEDSRFKALLARLMRPFTKVHPDEAAMVVLMTGCAFALLTAYYLLKIVREPLILSGGGAAVKLYARAGQGLVMVGFVHLYGQLARRVGRVKLLAIVFLFFISNLVVFVVLAGTGLSTGLAFGLAFFLWVGVFSYTVVAQFWALAADIYTEEQGKRLFPIIGAGSSIGAMVGALFARWLMQFGVQVLMTTALVILLGCLGVILWIERRAATHHVAGPHEDKHPDEPIARESAWHLLARDRYLLSIAGLVVFLNWVNSSGEYLLDKVLTAGASDAAVAAGIDRMRYIGEFKADYSFWYSSIGVVLQLFAVARVFKLIGVRNALFVMPIFAFGAYGLASLLPMLAVIRLVKIGENSLQYSLQDTTRNALFLVTSRVEKFVGKTATDTIAVRLGAVMTSITVLVGTSLGWSIATFLVINGGLALAWLGFVLLIRTEHRRRSTEEPAEIATEPHSGSPQHHAVGGLPARVT
jgi:AAA family ATP:ADP antiporter